VTSDATMVIASSSCPIPVPVDPLVVVEWLVQQRRTDGQETDRTRVLVLVLVLVVAIGCWLLAVASSNVWIRITYPSNAPSWVALRLRDPLELDVFQRILKSWTLLKAESCKIACCQ
jgi:hypothetical protein